MKSALRSATLILCALGSTAWAQTAWVPLPKQAPEPADNRATPAKVELGKMLYFDPRFSSTGTVSCFSCHNIMEGGDDHRPTSIGVHGQKGGRNSPTVWNSAFHSTQFWDGRAATLEDQAKGPPVNPIEMGMKDLGAVIERVRRIPGYKPYFVKAFGAGDVVTMDNAARAIAAYERTLITPGSAYDRYAAGDRAALTARSSVASRSSRRSAAPPATRARRSTAPRCRSAPASSRNSRPSSRAPTWRAMRWRRTWVDMKPRTWRATRTCGACRRC